LAAARAVDHLFLHARVLHVGRRAYPIGAIVTIGVRLIHFQGELGSIEWNISAPGRALPQAWWALYIPVCQLRTKTPSTDFSCVFWMPEPPGAGDYQLELILKDRTGTVGSPVFKSFSLTKG
jgi:hypothetical protein